MVHKWSKAVFSLIKQNSTKKEKSLKSEAFSEWLYKYVTAENLADYKPIVAAISGGKYIPTPGPIGSPSVL